MTVVLAGTNTGDDLWVGGTAGRGARALGKGRGSSTRRVGMGGEGDENDGMMKSYRKWENMSEMIRDPEGVKGRGNWEKMWSKLLSAWPSQLQIAIAQAPTADSVQ